MSQFNSLPSQQIDTIYRATNNTTDMSVNDTIAHSVTLQQGAIQVSQWYNKTQRKAIPAPVIGNLASIELDEYNANQNLVNYAVANNAVLSGQDTYENKILAGQYGEATPNNLDVLFQVDMRDIPNNQWLMLYATSSAQYSPTIGISVSNNGSDWDDLFNTGNYNVAITDHQGGDLTSTSVTLLVTNGGTLGSPIWIKPPTRFIRFLDLGGVNAYAMTALSSFSPPRLIQDLSVVNGLNILNNTVGYLPDEDRLYRVLVASTGFAVGDIARRSTRSVFSSPNSPTFTQWSNDTQKTIGLTAPALANLVALTNTQDGQNVDRRLNTTVSAFQLKATNALIKSVYIDNLGALMYLQIHQGLAATPATGAIPTETYRIPANGTLSIELDRVYTGQVWLAFSTTVATFTASAVAKNIYTRFN